MARRPNPEPNRRRGADAVAAGEREPRRDRAYERNNPRIDFPPYGTMHSALNNAATSALPPSGFSEQTWQAFFDMTLAEIADNVWPRWDGANRWVGRAIQTMSELTHSDLDLLEQHFRPMLEHPAGNTGDLKTATHESLFKIEDEVSVTVEFETVRRYLAGEPAGFISDVVRAANVGLRKGMGPRPLQYKQSLQRPRPYQASLLFGRIFSHELALTSQTPSIMSGHSIQGLFATTWAYVDQRTYIDSSGARKAALAQFAVDFGDRRVLAGVHYPSDNLASWYIDLNLTTVCFGPEAAAAKQFMVEAIKSSLVYRKLKEVIANDAQSVYRGMLQWLEQSF